LFGKSLRSEALLPHGFPSLSDQPRGVSRTIRFRWQHFGSCFARSATIIPARRAALGTGLVAAEDDGAWMPALDAIRFLLMAGWRRGEVLGLRWAEVDLTRRTASLDRQTHRLRAVSIPLRTPSSEIIDLRSAIISVEGKA
jgi:hypothetical protein